MTRSVWRTVLARKPIRAGVLFAVLAMLVIPAALDAATAGAPKTLRVNWTGSRTFGEGSVAFRVTRIVVDSSGWTVTAQLANRTDRALGVNRRAPESFRSCRMGLISFTRVKQTHGTLYGNEQLPATSSEPRLPATVLPGGSWHGTFHGRGALPRGTLLYVCLGYFTLPGEQLGFSWISDLGFRL